MFIPLIPDVDMTSLYFPEPDGVVLINLLSARNLENKDINLLQFKDKSDPYCKINLGKFMFRSKTVNNDLNPKFNEEYEAVVEDANIQTIRFELFDCDTTSSDEELGKLAIKLDGIKEAKSINKWYYLDACKHGEIHLGFEWILLKKEIEYLYKPLYLKDSKLYGKNVYNKEARCLLLIFVDSVNSLPCTKANVHPSPFITLELDKTIQKTPTKLNTICPIFQSKFSFFFAGPEDKTLKVVCKDDGSKKTLGELEIKINTLFTQPNMEFFQQIFYLTYGINQSSIILTAKLRVLEPAIMSKEKDGIDQFYGTGQHIERASKTDAFSPIIDMIPNNSTTTVLNQDTVEQITKGNGHIHVARPAVSVDTSHLHSPIKSMKSPGSVNSLMSESGSNVSRRKGILSKLTTKKHEMIKNALDFTLNNRELPQIEICLDYDKEKFLLQLEVISLKDLFPLEKNGHIQSYVNIKLFQIGKEGAVSKQSTHVVEDSCSPHFSAIFNFAIIPSHLPNYVLRFEVKDGINYGFKKPPVLAWGDYKLNDFNSDQKLVNYCMKLKQSADGR
uniref:C2 domain-containing protein n=1 Tax=Rhabditophanes sp. KR3021 TaxID=114890 RepID=A0AC35TT77_9BILA